MKKIIASLVMGFLLINLTNGCDKSADTTPAAPAATNAPATNAPAAH